MDEMNKLIRLLKGSGIDYEEHVILGGPQVLVRGESSRVSVIFHPGSYGFGYGLLEAWDFNNEQGSEGWLSAEQAFEYIKERIKE